MKLVVGLGNPGAAYARTRHNIGFDLVDALARSHHTAIANRRDQARVGRVTLDETPALLVKPQTFMNLSGDAVAAIATKEGIAPADILVVSDDVHLPVGRLRLRARGSAGGQGGLKSIEARLGTDAFPRLRLGVGEAPEGQRIDWVLSRFSLAERKLIDEVLIEAMGAVATWMTLGIETAMNRYNALDLRLSAKPTAKPQG